jgi:hypothetical protein
VLAKRNSVVKYTEKTMQDKLAQELIRRGHDCVLPNVYMRWGECDMVSQLPSGYVCDWEIKLRTSDFRADFKKRKHVHLKHKGYGRCHCPNYFWFVAPAGVVPVDEVPEYAGLLELRGNRPTDFTTVKRAPLLHKNMEEQKQFCKRIAHLAMFRVWNLRVKLRAEKAKRRIIV